MNKGLKINENESVYTKPIGITSHKSEFCVQRVQTFYPTFAQNETSDKVAHVNKYGCLDLLRDQS